jgi:integrase/recombinase XerD
MLLHKCQDQSSILYTLFDSEDRVVVHPTAYLRHLRKTHRPTSSQRQIAYVVKLHCQFLEDSEDFQCLSVDETLCELTSEDILSWIETQRAAGLEENTIHNREAIVREMYRWLSTKEASVCQSIPWDDGTFTRESHDKLPRFVTANQVIKLLDGMYNESQRVAAHFMYETGVRVSELVRLARSCLPNESDWPDYVNYYPLLVPGSKPYRGGKHKFRYTIISKPALARVNRYHSSLAYKLAKGWSMFDQEKPLFLNVNGERLTEAAVYKGIKAAWLRQGGNPTEMSPHRLRHGTGFSVLRSEFGRDLLDNLLVLKGMLGHADVKTTEIYASIPIAALQSIRDHKQVHPRYAEADEIFRATYLPARLQTEKRGHRK